MDSILIELAETFPGRKSQIEQLYNLYGRKDEPFPDCIYVYGASSTGKSAVVSAILHKCDVKHAVINLVECYTSKILFETILNKLSGHRIEPEKWSPHAKCDSMMDFIYYLKKCSENIDLTNAVVVFEQAELLRSMEHNLLPALMRLREILQLSVSLIFIGEIVFHKFHFKTLIDPIKIHFPQYSKEELSQILFLDFPKIPTFEGISEEFYRNYLNVFLSFFHRTCRDVSELRYNCRKNFPKYCVPILNNECTVKDSMQLWRNISPLLKSSLENLYSRVSENASARKQFAPDNLAQSVELPFYAKYLLIAAYLASYNPAKEDKRLFMKFHGKKKKTVKDVRAKSKTAERMNTKLGPKPFSFDRLLAIFYAILDDKVGFSNNLLVQVSSLVELQFLSALSDNCSLDGQKYKCMVGLEFIQTVSKMVSFNIARYLIDFN